jgi:hypothetical protein
LSPKKSLFKQEIFKLEREWEWARRVLEGVACDHQRHFLGLRWISNPRPFSTRRLMSNHDADRANLRLQMNNSHTDYRIDAEAKRAFSIA